MRRLIKNPETGGTKQLESCTSDLNFCKIYVFPFLSIRLKTLALSLLPSCLLNMLKYFISFYQTKKCAQNDSLFSLKKVSDFGLILFRKL